MRGAFLAHALATVETLTLQAPWDTPKAFRGKSSSKLRR